MIKIVRPWIDARVPTHPRPSPGREGRSLPSTPAPQGPLVAIVAVLAVASGCQKPFEEDRHDLATFRIAAVRAEPGVDPGTLTLSAFVYSGSGLYYDALPTLTWSVGETTVTEARPTVTVAYPATISLTASDDAGHTEDAVLELAAAPTPPILAALSRGATDLTIEDVVTPIEDRLTHAAGADTAVAAGGGLRLAVDMIDDGDRTTHWMATGGQFAELDAMSTDWFAGTATLDNGEIQESGPIDAGVWPLVALTYDGLGGNRWTYVDAAVDTTGPLLHVDGRLFPVDTTESGEGYWAATVALDDGPAGISLHDLVQVPSPMTDPAAPPAYCGLDPGVAFEFARLAEGLCTRADIDGASIIVYGTVVP